MEEQVKKVKKKRKLSKSGLIIIIGISIILIPCIVFAAILGKSWLETSSPREGSRFDGDLVNEITKDDISSLKNDLNAIGNIDEVDVVLSEGQLKIYIDTNDSLSEQQVDDIVSSAYSKVTSKLPINRYFTRTDSAKMYDLQINVYTSLEESANRQYKFLHKNAAEEEFGIDDLAHPKDPKLVAELEGTAQEGGEDNTSEGSEE